MLIGHSPWPTGLESCSRFGLDLIRKNEASSKPNVLLVRGSALVRPNKSDTILLGLSGDWVREKWPIIVYLQGQAAVCDRLKDKFKREGSGGYSFPVCSCVPS